MPLPACEGGLSPRIVLVLCVLSFGCAFGATGTNAPAASPSLQSDRRGAAVLRLLNSRAAGDMRGYAEAARIVREDADRGAKLQQFVLAIAASEPHPPPAAQLDKTRRRELLEAARPEIRRIAEERNNALAWYLLALEDNDFIYLGKAVSLGNVQALNAWGSMTLTRALEEAPRDEAERRDTLKRCFDCFSRAAAAKDANGAYNLGTCYMNGYGCERDERLALECWRTAAEAGHPEAINNIGGLYRDGIIVKKNPHLAALWFRKSADLGNSYGQLNYAIMLQSGVGVEKDETQARALFELACAQDNPEAMNLYGMCFLRGRGVPQDTRKALFWFRKAAELGYPIAMDNLSDCYGEGAPGLEADAFESLVWHFRAKAACGDRAAAKWLKENGK